MLTWGERFWVAVDRAWSTDVPEEQVVPSAQTGGRKRIVKREIKSDITGEVIGWEEPDGEWVMKSQTQRENGKESSPVERHLDAMAEFAKGRWTSDNDSPITPYVPLGSLLS